MSPPTSSASGSDLGGIRVHPESNIWTHVEAIDRGKSVMEIKPTGFCHACGREIPLLRVFCNDTCARRYDREQWAQENRGIKRGRGRGYGLSGITNQREDVT